jgi:uncharacterized membrane protein YeaQ/YmgE (transglycosylase-associated protein family)
MDPVAIIIMLVIGAVAGWLAGLIYSGAGFGLVGNIIVGIVGAIIAGYLLPGYLNFSGSSARSSAPRLARSFCCSW